MSVGNVGQLSVDLLLASLGGNGADVESVITTTYSVDHPGILPMVGLSAIDPISTDLMTACQRRCY